ncbi:transmembrane protein 43-like [Mytilus edulis]|uniref:transmembrane protein 43-like n=1 Tax=Mytilus edulis TaxID=6550 RepID=UPI0039F14300
MYRRQYPDAPGPGSSMGDSHTRVSYRRNPNFFERIGNSLVGILVGIALLVVASGLLFWNEGRAVQTAKSLDEGLSIVVSLENIDVPFDQNNGKLVHLAGPLKTEKSLLDPTYNIRVNAVKLRRTVEMYQWVEHESKREYNEGGQTRVEKTYSYTQEWRSDLVRSQSFDNMVGHNNPTSMPVNSQLQTADIVHVGGFELSGGLVEKITDFKKINPSAMSPPSDPKIQMLEGVYYHSHYPLQPQVGDLRVTFEYAGISGESLLGQPDTVSIIARQIRHRLLPYQTAAGDVLEMLYTGRLSPKEIFGKEQQQNTMITWGVRLGGWLLIFVGFGCLTSIITTLVDWLPIIRELVAAGVGIMNLAFSISLSLTVIAIGWITYRPLLGMALLAMAATPFIMSKFRSNRMDSRRNV